MPIHSPLEPSKLHLTNFIEGCSCSNTIADFLRRLLTSDVFIWTIGSVPSPLSAGSAGVQAACRRCSSSSSLSYSAGLISSSFSVEFLALVYGLEWCHFHLKTCHFQSALFLTNSQSALALLSMAPAFLLGTKVFLRYLEPF